MFPRSRRTLSIELGRGSRTVVCLSLHPGTVSTDLTVPYRKNIPAEKLFSPEKSVRHMLEIIDGAGREDSGRFIAWDGKNIEF